MCGGGSVRPEVKKGDEASGSERSEGAFCSLFDGWSEGDRRGTSRIEPCCKQDKKRQSRAH